MFCSNCGQENPPDARFCKSCGTLLSVGAERPLRNNNVDLGLGSIIKNKKQKIVGIILLILIGLSATVLYQPQTPLNAAEKYLDALTDHDYAKAYNYINPELNIPRSAYVYTMRETEKKLGAVNKYRIENADITEKIQTSSLERLYTVVMDRNKRDTEILSIKNVGTIRKPEWKVFPSSSYYKKVLHLGGLQNPVVTVCDEKVQIDGEGNCTVTNFNDIRLPLEISSPNIVTKKLEYPSEVKDDLYFLITDKLQAEMEKTANGFFISLQKAKENQDVNEMAAYVIRESKLWNTIKEFILEKEGFREEIVTIEKVEPGTIRLYEDRFKLFLLITTQYRIPGQSLIYNGERMVFINENGKWFVERVDGMSDFN